MALLNLTRHTAEILQSTKKLWWDFLSSIKWLHDLDVLILWTGNIGSVTGELCQSLGMNVDFYTRWDDLSSKINWKQVIINCLRLNEETTWLINANSLLWFRWYYISSAGHEIDNQHEIIELIKSNTLKWYARDWTHEMAWADAWNMDYQYLQKTLAWYNVFITPAIAWSTTHAIRYSNDVCIENIKQYIQGAPINLLY
jgi:lactate dehydrogenase-like 2-hydroxyacid dehydrogenase